MPAKRRKSKAPKSGGVEQNKQDLNGALGKLKISNRSVTGVLSSHPSSRDIHIEQFTLTFHGTELLSEAKLELNYGRRYGLIGLNGCGKCTYYTELTVS